MRVLNRTQDLERVERQLIVRPEVKHVVQQPVENVMHVLAARHVLPIKTGEQLEVLRTVAETVGDCRSQLPVSSNRHP